VRVSKKRGFFDALSLRDRALAAFRGARRRSRKGFAVGACGRGMACGSAWAQRTTAVRRGHLPRPPQLLLPTVRRATLFAGR